MSKGRTETTTTKSFWCRLLLLLLPICYFFCTTFSIFFFFFLLCTFLSQMILIVYFVDKKFRRRHVCSKAAIAFSFWILFAQPAAVRCNSNLSLNTQYRLHFPLQIRTALAYQRLCNYSSSYALFSILLFLVKCKIVKVAEADVLIMTKDCGITSSAESSFNYGSEATQAKTQLGLLSPCLTWNKGENLMPSSLTYSRL